MKLVFHHRGHEVHEDIKLRALCVLRGKYRNYDFQSGLGLIILNKLLFTTKFIEDTKKVNLRELRDFKVIKVIPYHLPLGLCLRSLSPERCPSL